MRFNLISINNIYLTSDGTAVGNPCKTSVTGLDSLNLDYVGTNVIALDGTPYAQILHNRGKGLPFSIKVQSMTESRFTSLVSAVNSAIGLSQTIEVYLQGETGTFALACLPNFPKPLEHNSEFRNGTIFNTTFNFVVQSQGLVMLATSGTYTTTGNSVNLTLT